MWPIVAMVAALAAYNIARSALIPNGAHFVSNLSFAAAVVLAAVSIGMSTDQMGLERDRLGRGVRLGACAAAAIAAVVVIAALVPAAGGSFDDDRVDVSFGRMLLRVVIVIPLGTALTEELVFRGVLHGLLRDRLATVASALVGATIFGVWHLYPVWRGFDMSTGGDLGRAAAVFGTFVATFGAGLGFVWLRHRAGHVAASFLAHIGTNSVPFAVAWIVS